MISPKPPSSCLLLPSLDTLRYSFLSSFPLIFHYLNFSPVPLPSSSPPPLPSSSSSFLSPLFPSSLFLPPALLLPLPYSFTSPLIFPSYLFLLFFCLFLFPHIPLPALLLSEK